MGRVRYFIVGIPINKNIVYGFLGKALAKTFP